MVSQIAGCAKRRRSAKNRYRAKRQDNRQGKRYALNYFIQSATVAVYNESYSDLLAYTLTNSFGEFSLGGLLLNKTLRVKISYIGYETFDECLPSVPRVSISIWVKSGCM